MAAEHQTLIAYLRVSSETRDTQLQHGALIDAGCGKFFEDRIPSRKTDRPSLAAAMDHLRPGDTLAVWKLDRLGRSVKAILTLADELHEREIGLRILTGTLAGTYTPRGGQVLLHHHGSVRRAGTRHDPPAHHRRARRRSCSGPRWRSAHRDEPR